MNVVDEHNETICGKKKTFTRREESKDFGRGLSLMNEWRRQAQRDHSWNELNLHKKRRK
jgi:hypothetical protein